MRTCRSIHATATSKYEHCGSEDKDPTAWFRREQCQCNKYSDPYEKQPEPRNRLEDLASELVKRILNNGPGF